jgi:hypothetical protein
VTDTELERLTYETRSALFGPPDWEVRVTDAMPRVRAEMFAEAMGRPGKAGEREYRHVSVEAVQ